MKKHILGFILFAAIVGAMAITVWFLKLSVLSEVPEPFAVNPRQTSSDRSFTYQVQNIVFDLDSGMLISRIQLKWNGVGERPTNLWISTSVSDDRQTKRTSVGSELIADPFKNGDQVVITAKTPGIITPRLDGKNNYYALFSISADRSSADLIENTVTSGIPILFLHGEGSRIVR
ncbi:MAG TPA: hypothetical protein VK612_03230 [Pyrinomonadaceae bacterium]|nr:hypothetical protein [Pyrinomonadaceae bacterium]